MDDLGAEAERGAAYRVLARKHRPATFADLIGQDAMVRTLRNAFEADRIAHAFVLTGVRGVGKTTTARIIAKGLNCVGPDGTGGPTVAPCGVCEPCRGIAEGRHVDVLEMDAASRTGVGDIREIIDSVAYRAASARYKVYIIDEVHMLSTSAFNALLKTLEEPPEHVKFLFATTEIRKVPVTVLSRCQRFDLRRIEPEAMLAHLRGIAAAEAVEIAPDALALIVRAAEGSVRDALSLMDQAIAHGGGATGVAEVRAMLGLADRGRVLDLFASVMRGDAAGALAELAAQYADGAEPSAVLRDLAEVTHWVSMIKITPAAADDPTVGPDERARGLDFAARLAMRALTRMWQMLLKALEEAAAAPNPLTAAEMAIIRLTHVADLPTPEELIRRLNAVPPATPGPAPAAGAERSAAPGAPRAGAEPDPPAQGFLAVSDEAERRATSVPRPADADGSARNTGAGASQGATGADGGAKVEAAPAASADNAGGAARTHARRTVPGSADGAAKSAVPAAAGGAEAAAAANVGEAPTARSQVGGPGAGHLMPEPAESAGGAENARPADVDLGAAASAPRAVAHPPRASIGPGSALPGRGGGAAAARAQEAPVLATSGRDAADARATPAPGADALSRYATFADVVALVRARRDMSLLVEIETGLRLVKYAPGRIEFEPDPRAAPDFAPRLASRLQAWTGARWGVSVVSGGGAATLAEELAARRGEMMRAAEAHPLVQAVLAAFPGAAIRDIRPPEVAAAPEQPEPEDDDAWDPLDPFDEE